MAQSSTRRASYQKAADARKTATRTEWFLTTDKVRAILGKARAKALNYQGGLVRKIARQSIRQKGKARREPKSEKAKEKWRRETRRTPASPPGTPPFTHTGFLRQDIQYALDPAKLMVVVGPYRSPWLNELHEFGGNLPMTQYRRGDSGRAFWYRSAGRKSRHWTATGKKKTVRYPARPYMHPALTKVTQQLPRAWEAVLT